MNEGLIPRRYAKALFKTASERGLSERMYQLMQNLSASFDASADLSALVNNPYVTFDDKLRILETAAAASSSDSLFDDFLKLLENNRRIGLTGAIAHAFEAEYRRENNICLVTLTSAAKLPEQVTDRIISLIRSHLPEGATMQFSSAINPDLLGGFVISIDNQRLDASVKNSLNDLRLQLLNK